jgi:hypothetical protein
VLSCSYKTQPCVRLPRFATLRLYKSCAAAVCRVAAVRVMIYGNPFD